ncbi:MAG: sigma-70 family RNA polymerase sigma factor [Nostocaceae cyanobacterium CSU_2_110]|nr:sigma-70 family RNA polymerase sigma factor [Nostocaceae cyanobacterium CSU_2_110]
MTEPQTPEVKDIKTSGGNYCEHIERHYIHAETVNIYETATKPNDTSSNNGKVVIDKKQLAFAIAGSIDEIDQVKLKAILALLKKISGDASIEIIRVEEGSIRLILEGSEEGLERIKEVFESGELTEVLGDAVEYVEYIDSTISGEDAAKNLLVQAPYLAQLFIDSQENKDEKNINQITKTGKSSIALLTKGDKNNISYQQLISQRINSIQKQFPELENNTVLAAMRHYYRLRLRQYGLLERYEPDDILNTAILRLVRAIDLGKSICNVVPWVRQTGLNIIHELSKEKHRITHLEALETNLPDEENSGKSEDNELYIQLYEAIQQLSSEDRELLVLRFYQQLSWADIVKLLADKDTYVSEAALRRRASHALSKLRKIFNANQYSTSGSYEVHPQG